MDRKAKKSAKTQLVYGLEDEIDEKYWKIDGPWKIYEKIKYLAFLKVNAEVLTNKATRRSCKVF